MAQIIASFVFGFFLGLPVGIILLCFHLRTPAQGGGVRDDVRWVHVGQLLFFAGPIVLASLLIYEVVGGRYHLPEASFVGGMFAGMVGLYGYFYVSLKLWRGRKS
jgi:hypothetical protein